ncbi:MAG: hypothetical protein ACRDA4_08110 [Filifactoraceae bacterium]
MELDINTLKFLKKENEYLIYNEVKKAYEDKSTIEPILDKEELNALVIIDNYLDTEIESIESEMKIKEEN